MKNDDNFFKIYYSTILSSKVFVFNLSFYCPQQSSKILIKNFITVHFFILEEDPVSFPFLLLFQWKLITRQVAKILISISASNDIHIKRVQRAFFDNGNKFCNSISTFLESLVTIAAYEKYNSI